MSNWGKRPFAAKLAPLVCATALVACTSGGGSSDGGLVEEEQNDLQVSPSSGFASSGPAGGPFTPSGQDYLLSNVGSAALDWTAEADAPWLKVSPTSGQLEAGQQTTLNVALDETAAAGLSLGSFAATVTIDDTTAGTSTQRGATLNVVAPTGGSQSSSLSQFGITWDFEGAYETGQFANGDWWVVGPVTIVGISPPSTPVEGRTMHGSMVNPSPRSGMQQGYDSHTYGQYKSANDYLPSLNVALGVSPQNPLVLQPHSSLVSTISDPLAGARPQLATAAILTVLDAPAPPGSFRPPYCGPDKTIRFNESQLDWSRLASLEPVESTPPLAEVERWFERPWLDHIPMWVGHYIHPRDNMENYGRDMTDHVSVAALMLHLDMPQAQKRDLLVRYVQLGIDFFGIVEDGGNENWPPAAGHMSGRKWPILFAGLMLGDPAMSGIGFDKSVQFGEDGQTFYVAETSPGVINFGYGAYLQQEIGMAEWGTSHTTFPELDDWRWEFDDPLRPGQTPPRITNTIGYRLCCTANVWWGQLLAALVMDAKDLWDHPALFDYQDRFLQENAQRGISDYRLSWRSFYFDMWEKYRSNY